jgi:hypothetical protein
MYSVRFVNRREIRMGSPYNLADPIITGDFVPNLSEYEFQDVSAVSPNGKNLYLVFWDLQGNAPAFRVLWLSEEERCIRTSERIPSACRELITTDIPESLDAQIWDLFQGDRLVRITFPR